ncbi:hypothetical protein JKP88DRAFT_315428 [Tribonema minus]|uniref:PDZ domain-containing protein n=1 Tax=Tribonema minus TaxID=303371 RepID=A0A836CHV6_9STRA|nr:hypothetical protein JKP88DRAFT_315428 [Tribonema minus]
MLGAIHVASRSGSQLENAALAAVLKATGDRYSSTIKIRSAAGALARSALPPPSAPPTDSTPGLGIAIVKDSSRRGILTATAVFEEGPAWTAGVRVGDRIVSVNGQSVAAGASVAAVTALANAEPIAVLRYERDGLEGVRVAEVERRPGAEAAPRAVRLACTVPLITGSIVTKAAPAPATVGYIKLNDFGESAAEEMTQAVLSLFSQPQAPIKALVVDVRDNPGGLLDQAVDVAALLLPRGSPVVRIVDGQGDAVTLSTETEPLLPARLPLVLLVNGDTRSAAEVLAAAVQDTDRGVVVGGATYGKGTAQSVRRIAGRDELLLRLTTARYLTPRYLTPSGRSVDKAWPPAQALHQTLKHRTVRGGRGVEPDLATPAAQRPGPLEKVLLRDGAFFDYASQWQRSHPAVVHALAADSAAAAAAALSTAASYNGVLAADFKAAAPLSNAAAFTGGEQGVADQTAAMLSNTAASNGGEQGVSDQSTAAALSNAAAINGKHGVSDQSQRSAGPVGGAAAALLSAAAADGGRALLEEAIAADASQGGEGGGGFAPWVAREYLPTLKADEALLGVARGLRGEGLEGAARSVEAAAGVEVADLQADLLVHVPAER